MKQCPACSARYEDDVSFCSRDGRALVAKIAERSRLCPHCANSIPQIASKCPYCKADLSASPAPQWPEREEISPDPEPTPRHPALPLGSKLILAAGFLLFGLGVFLVGGQTERSESRPLLDEKIKELQDKDQTIREKDQRIQSLENQLAQVRQQLSEHADQLSALKAKFEESQNALATTQQRLSSATREVERLGAGRAQAPTRASPRSDSPSSSRVRRNAEPGVYQTIRPTAVHEQPSGDSRTLSEIKKGTRVTVVRSIGDWLEVRSKLGNPPGYIRWDDAMLLSRAD